LERMGIARYTAGRVRTAQSASAALGCPASSLTFAPKVWKNRFKYSVTSGERRKYHIMNRIRFDGVLQQSHSNQFCTK
jgi:hypothetical protein